jgi:hypothetical protein
MLSSILYTLQKYFKYNQTEEDEIHEICFMHGEEKKLKILKEEEYLECSCVGVKTDTFDKVSNSMRDYEFD